MANFVRRCACGTLVKLPKLDETAQCTNCGAGVRVQNKRSNSDQQEMEEPVTITPRFED